MTDIEFKTHRTEKLKMNQSQLADIIGVSVAAILMWESGNRKVPKPAIRIAKLIHIYPQLIGTIRTM